MLLLLFFQFFLKPKILTTKRLEGLRHIRIQQTLLAWFKLLFKAFKKRREKTWRNVCIFAGVGRLAPLALLKNNRFHCRFFKKKGKAHGYLRFTPLPFPLPPQTIYKHNGKGKNFFLKKIVLIDRLRVDTMGHEK